MVSDQDAWDKIIAVPLWLRMSVYISLASAAQQARKDIYFKLDIRLQYYSTTMYYICFSSTFAPKPL